MGLFRRLTFFIPTRNLVQNKEKQNREKTLGNRFLFLYFAICIRILIILNINTGIVVNTFTLKCLIKTYPLVIDHCNVTSC